MDYKCRFNNSRMRDKMKVGYARMSTMDQNLGQQLEVLENVVADESHF